MYQIIPAEHSDLPVILKLQYLAYQSEAALFHSQDIPPLKQTLEEVEAEFREGLILKLADAQNSIIGSVRAREQDGTVYIGKLMVHPDYRCRGCGTALLRAAEERFPGRRYELFTSTRSVRNIRLYEEAGYRIFRRETLNAELEFVYMEKCEDDRRSNS